MPTGDPNIPKEVRRAKHIRYKMTERAQIGVGEETNVDDVLTESMTMNAFQSDDVDPACPESSSKHGRSTNSFTLSTSNSDSNLRTPMNHKQINPRPLVHLRAATRDLRDEPDDLITLLKAQNMTNYRPGHQPHLIEIYIFKKVQLVTNHTHNGM